MRRSRKPIVIASRRSRLARMQAELVAKALRRLHPGVEVEFLWIESEGDQIRQGSLAEHGGKGLFTRGVDQAVADGRADLAVHSLKDLPVDPSESVAGLVLAAVPKRGPVHDVLVSAGRYASLEQLPTGAVVGTSSPRRAAQLRRARGDLRVHLLRGNVDTRLGKVLSDGQPPQYDAAVLAAAGLQRLGLGEHADRPLHVDVMLPAACQGAIGIRCRATDHVTLTRCLPLNHAATSTSVTAEREVVGLLGADCYSPIAVLADQVDPAQTRAKRNADSHWFRLRVRVCAADGSRMLEADERCKTSELRHCTRKVVEGLVSRGARELLIDAARHTLVAPPTHAPSRDQDRPLPDADRGAGQHADDAEPSPGRVTTFSGQSPNASHAARLHSPQAFAD